MWRDDVWIVDSTPVECGRSRETVKRSDLAGWAEYGYCASHSRFFWGLRLHLVFTLQGLPVAFALTGAKADERETLLDLLAAEPGLVADRPGQTMIGDRNYFGRGFEQELAEQDIRLLRPASPQGRARAARSALVQAVAASHRVGQRDLQGSTRSRTAPRAHARRRRRPCHAANPRHDRRDLAQRPNRTGRPSLTDRLRPLLNLNS
ncbi:transposase [Streptomyces canus]|uniref:transposase n=1 Tax=Streptomyces canus TaxID=58343 RepID=UPI0027D87DF2|nr:transposase [Streptomyces canus]